MKATTLVGCMVGLGAGVGTWAGCGGGSSSFAPIETDSGTHPWAADPTCAIDATDVHGVTTDGRVNVTAAEAWPSRPAEPAPPTASERLGACAILSTCLTVSPDGGVPSDADEIKSLVSCVAPKASEERAIPELLQNERWSFKVKSIIAKAGCAGAQIGSKFPPGINCEEHGCSWSGPVPPTVTCAGTVASVAGSSGTVTRDCASSYTACSTMSGTGCTDRPRVACQSAGNDRCDGDIKLGCDRCGLVSFHDCGLQGGHCVENPGGAACVYADPGTCTAAPSCSGSTLTSCVGGAPTTVDCATLGLAGCSNGHCTK